MLELPTTVPCVGLYVKQPASSVPIAEALHTGALDVQYETAPHLQIAALSKPMFLKPSFKPMQGDKKPELVLLVLPL
jgi:hypothetical protein